MKQYTFDEKRMVIISLFITILSVPLVYLLYQRGLFGPKLIGTDDISMFKMALLDDPTILIILCCMVFGFVGLLKKKGPEYYPLFRQWIYIRFFIILLVVIAMVSYYFIRHPLSSLMNAVGTLAIIYFCVSLCIVGFIRKEYPTP